LETKPTVLHVLELCAQASSSTQRNITTDQMTAKILTTIPLPHLYCEIPKGSLHISPFYPLRHMVEKTIGK
jgi:hypothetical protein